LLGVAEGADAAAIQTAWRIAISNAHPDAGGSDAAARAVTEARDLLLARLGK
jgi:curved DNA-binding protein CbpA